MEKVIVFPVLQKYDWTGKLHNYTIMEHYQADRRTDVIQPTLLTIFTPADLFSPEGLSSAERPICLLGEQKKAGLLLHFAYSDLELDPSFNCVTVEADELKRKSKWNSTLRNRFHLNAELFPGVDAEKLDLWRPGTVMFIPPRSREFPYRNHISTLLLCSVPGFSGETTTVKQYLEKAPEDDLFAVGLRTLLYNG